MKRPWRPEALFPRTGAVADLVMAAGKLRPVVGRSGFCHLFGDVELVDKALRDDAITAVRLFDLPSHNGAFADLQAVDCLTLDQGRERAGGLAVTGLSAFRRIDPANPDAYATGFRLHCEGVAVRYSGYLAEVICVRHVRNRQCHHQDRHMWFHRVPQYPEFRHTIAGSLPEHQTPTARLFVRLPGGPVQCLIPELTRRRYPEARDECWHVYYGDIYAGTLAIRAGNPQATHCR